MDASVRSRSTRDRPAKAPLSEAAIVDAALAIARTDGLAAVTMRRVAAELDTGAAPPYGLVPAGEPGPEPRPKAAARPPRRLPRGARNLPRPRHRAAGGAAGDRQRPRLAREPARPDGRPRHRPAGGGLGLAQPE